jgi:hypothetical protein
VKATQREQRTALASQRPFARCSLTDRMQVQKFIA